MASFPVRQVPAAAPFVIERGRLAGLLRPTDGDAPRFVLVTAPAGSGKTTLLVEMAALVQEAGAEVAWLSVRSDDAAEGRFPARVLRTLGASIGPRAPLAAGRLAALPVPADPLDPGFVAEAALPLRQTQLPVWLFVDDHHVLEGDQALAWLDRYATAAGPGLHVVVAGRHDLGGALTPRLLDGSAVHVTGADLAFSPAETAEVLAGQGLRLGETEVQELHRRTEGWAAGLRLAALTLSGAADPAAVLSSLTGSTRAIGAYLVAEVLHGLPVESQNFLRATAAPRILTVDLAAALSGRDDAGAVLEQLLTDGQLITRQEGPQPTYRYHALLRHHLLEEEAALDLARYHRQRRASAQHAADRGEVAEALDQATAGQAWDLVVDLLDRYGLPMVLRGDEAAVVWALVSVPSSERTTRLVLLAAELNLRQGELGGAQTDLTVLPPPSAAPETAETEALRTAVLLHAGILSGHPGPGFRALLASSDAVPGTPEGMLLSSVRGMALIEVDEPLRAKAELRRAQQLATEHGYDALALDCLSHRILLAAGESRHPEVIALVEEAIDFATARGWQTTAPMAAIYLAGGSGGFAMCERTVGERYLRLAQVLSPHVEPKLGAFGALMRVYLEHALRRSPATFSAAVREVWAGIDERVIRQAGMTSLCLVEIGLAADQGDATLLEEVAERAERRMAGRGDLLVVRAALLLHRGRPAEALDVLSELQAAGLRTTTRGNVQAAIVRASAELATGREGEACASLLTAVEVAGARELVEPLAVASPRLLHLLERGHADFDESETFVRRVLAAAAARRAHEDKPAATHVRLTRREDAILRELASMSTLQEIADRQRVSENTVKSHVKAIYDKLGVHNRRDAVRAGQARTPGA